jgi:hypothetical protein
MRSVLRFEAFGGRIFSTAQECMIYEKEFKKNTYEVTLRASVVFRIDGLELPVQVKCCNHLIKNDPYGVELASLAEDDLYKTYEVKDLLELAKKQNLEIYLDCLENTRAINPKLIEGEI